MPTRLIDIATVIRSKNAGPFELTLDVIFKSESIYTAVTESNLLNASLLCDLYKIAPKDVISIVYFKPANAVKMTIRRPIVSGAVGDTDIYGAQQHAPLLNIEINSLIDF
jgi:Domain of unknown function (DUF4387)